MSGENTGALSWLDIVRIGLVQTSIGAVVVIATSTLNRVMVVEIGLPALVPGVLMTLHYAVQILRPRWGHGSDGGRRRTPWIIGGMGALAIGGALAAVGTVLMQSDLTLGLAVALGAFLLLGMGVGAAGTSLLTLLAERVNPARRAPAATIVWTMMIAGFAVTAISAGKALEPFSGERLIVVAGVVSAIALVVSTLAILGVERKGAARAPEAKAKTPFKQALREVWSEPRTRRFTLFVFTSMFAYNAQDLILEPFAGLVFGMTPGQSTQLGGMQHAGVLVGMVLVALAGHFAGRREAVLLQRCMIGGCIASGLAMSAVAAGGNVGPQWPIRSAVFVLGVANGVFSIAAIGSMMAMARSGHESREGVRMGLWGAAQALAFALGGFCGTLAVDVARYAFGEPTPAYTAVFLGEGVLFMLAALLALAVARDRRDVAQDEASYSGAMEHAR
jgi:BCD family chlorophyll transporter-like MFS transporter